MSAYGRHLFIVFILLTFLSSCSSSSQATVRTPTPTPVLTADQVWAELEQRPVNVPTLAAGSSCPAAHGHAISPDFGLGLGDGPAYPVGLGSDGVLDYAPPQNFQSAEWGGMKVLWALSPTYNGVVLVRGHQLDGPNELRFERGDVPPAELRIIPFPASTPDGWTGQPSYTRVRAPGCYAYQVDGLTFSKLIIFRAVPAT